MPLDNTFYEEHGRFVETLAEELVGTRDYDGDAVGGWVVRSDTYGRRYWVEDGVGEELWDDVNIPSRDYYSRDHERVRDPFLEGLAKEYDGIFKITHSADRIPEWSRILVEHDYIDRVDTETLRKSVEDVEVPVSIVADGRPAVFAYLATHGTSNHYIAELFDIKKNTVRTNLSKFKNHLTEQ
jgi:hypothetical protein